jgi:hypothetical protein
VRSTAASASNTRLRRTRGPAAGARHKSARTRHRALGEVPAADSSSSSSVFKVTLHADLVTDDFSLQPPERCGMGVKRNGSSLTGRVVPRASLRERHGAQRAAQASGHDAHGARVEGARLRGPAGTRASRPVDAPPAQAMGDNGCKRGRGWTDRRTPRRLEEGHGGHAEPGGRSAHRACRRLPERRHASNLHPRRAYVSKLSP